MIKLAIPILVGFAKPLIRTAFAILLFAIINSNIIIIPQLQKDKDLNNGSRDATFYLFFTLSFLVGFNERLANDILRREEATILPKTEREILKKVKNTAQEVRNTAHGVEEDEIGSNPSN